MRDINIAQYSVVVLFWLIIGAVGGYFGGKSAVHDVLMSEAIECKVTVDPITEGIL